MGRFIQELAVAVGLEEGQLPGPSTFAAVMKAGQEISHFRLHPGEEVRSPLIALQFWTGGDWIDAQNIWRRWMIASTSD